jgi:protein TonB
MRYVVSMLAGIVMAVLLFWLMQGLVANKKSFERQQDAGKLVDFVRVRQDELVQERERKPPKKPPPPDKPPPPPKLSVQDTSKPPPTPLDIETPNIDVPFGGSGPYIGSWSPGDPAAEGDVVPIVRIEPQYPREALLKGIEGWVKVKFVILEDGSVDSPTVIEAEPNRLFNRAAIRAILRWKFKPRIVDGQAVRREAEQIIEFSLNQQS